MMNFSNNQIITASDNNLIEAIQNTGMIDTLVSTHDRRTWEQRLTALRTDMFQLSPDQQLSQTINTCLRAEYAQVINRLAETLNCQSTADLDAVITRLRAWIELMQVVSMVTAIDLNREHWLRIRDWLSHHIGQTVLIDPHQNPSLGAGAIVYWQGHQFVGTVLDYQTFKQTSTALKYTSIN